MTKTTTPELNRLRAAAGLIPIIESGLVDGNISLPRIQQMVAFCEWAARNEVAEIEGQALKEYVLKGLQNLHLHNSEL